MPFAQAEIPRLEEARLSVLATASCSRGGSPALCTMRCLRSIWPTTWTSTPSGSTGESPRVEACCSTGSSSKPSKQTLIRSLTCADLCSQWMFRSDLTQADTQYTCTGQDLSATHDCRSRRRRQYKRRTRRARKRERRCCGSFVPFDELAAGRPTRWSLAASGAGSSAPRGHRSWPVLTYILVIQQVSSPSADLHPGDSPASTARSAPSTNHCAAPEPLTGNRSEVPHFADHHTNARYENRR
jgi:hypothetical protein